MDLDANLKQFTKESALQYSEQTRLITWLTISSITICVGLVTLFGYIRFRRMYGLIIIQKRYPRIVLLEAKLSMLISFILLPMMQLNSSYFSFVSEYQVYISIVTWLLYPICHWVVGCEVARLWLICYDLNHLKDISNNQWKQEINNKLKKNWWIENRKTYGNYAYVTRRWALFFFCTGIIISIVYELWDRNSLTMPIDGGLYGMPVVFTIYLYWKCPKIVDKLFFQLEFKTTTLCFVTALLVFFIGQIIAFFNPYFGEIINLMAGLYAFSTASIVSTLWIPHLIISKRIWNDQWNLEKAMALMLVASSSKMELKSPRDRESQIPPLTDVFSDRETIESFALHLSNEFSLECFLSFVECIQYKLHLRKTFNDSSADFVLLDNRHKISFTFDKSLKSSIVYDVSNAVESKPFDYDKTMKRFKLSALMLYDKYIRCGSELEVNIDSASRLNYMNLFRCKDNWLKMNVTENDLFDIFDPLCCQMYKLMEHSLARFVMDSA